MYVHEIQNTVNGEVKDACVTPLQHHADKELEVTTDPKEVFQYAYAQGGFEMESVIVISDAQGDGFDGRVK